MPKRDSNFFWQTIQETAALYTLLPVRILHAGAREEIFHYINDSKMFSVRFESETKMAEHIGAILDTLPNFFDEREVERSALPMMTEKIKSRHIRAIRDILYFTKSSFNPFLMATLDASVPVKVCKLLFYLKILFHGDTDENRLHATHFLGFSYHYFRLGDYLFLLGPVMTSKRFHDEADRLVYVKAIKYYFKLTLHTYELLNLLNQRNPTDKDQFLAKAKFVKKVFQAVVHSNDDPPRRKRELRELATHFIALSAKTKKKRSVNTEIVHNNAFFKTATRISDNQIMRDLEAIEWFNDFIFQHLSFENRLDPFDHYALTYLENMLQADGYFIVNYTRYDHSLRVVPAQTRLHESASRTLHHNITFCNQDRQQLEQSYTWFVINEYQQHKNPICLIEESGQMRQKFCPQIGGSILSIPLVFEKRVFAVVHFVAQEVAHFDEIDQRFLLKLSSPLGKRYIEYRLNHCLDQSLTLLEGLSNVTDRVHLQRKTDQICAHIADAFCSDGVILWFNQQEVFHTPKEANELTILSEVGFLSEEERAAELRYPLALSDEENLIIRLAQKEVVIIDNLQKSCSDNKEDDFYMKYKAAFVEKGIDSMMFIVIKNAKGKISGALMIYDKSYRSYTTLARRMLMRIGIYIGSVLTTVTYAKYQNQKLDERNLHESAQYLNVINSRARDLEQTLAEMNLPRSREKHRLFLNIEDIKDFTQYTRRFLFTLFSGGHFIKKYDDLVATNIQEIHHNREYTSFNKVLNQLLAVHKNRMHQTKDIYYKKSISHDLLIRIPSQQLLDILSNIIGNAIKYGQQGKFIRIWDEMHFNYYNIHIENIGYPIYPEERERIFEKGVRGYVTKSLLAEKEAFTQTLSSNKGLGLYIAKMLMKEGLGGNLILRESQPFGNSGFHRNIFVIKIPTDKIRKKDAKTAMARR